jgi:hypothetical protein
MAAMCALMADQYCIMPEFVDAGGNVCFITNASAWVLDRAVSADHLARLLLDVPRCGALRLIQKLRTIGGDSEKKR